MTGLSWQEGELVGEVAGSLLSLASYIEHKPDGADRLKAAVVAALRPVDVALLHDLSSLQYRAEHEQRIAGMTTEQLHEERCHPGFEYATTEGQRKAWDYSDVPPDGDGWVRNVHVGDRGWERFDYTEESYWMREWQGRSASTGG